MDALRTVDVIIFRTSFFFDFPTFGGVHLQGFAAGVFHRAAATQKAVFRDGVFRGKIHVQLGLRFHVRKGVKHARLFFRGLLFVRDYAHEYRADLQGQESVALRLR